MARMPQEYAESPTVKAIYAAREKTQKSGLRPYLGASLIGGECDRALWYAFRWAMPEEKHEGRMVRLLETGDLAEPRFAAELRLIGCEVHTHDEAGEQFGFRDLGGHFSGHMDGAIFGLPEAPKSWHVAEFKTHNEKSFNELTKKGVRASKPRHYAQMQTYMRQFGMDHALYLAENKNTSEIYSERIELNREDADAYRARAEYVITAAAPPERAGGDADAFVCKWCDFKEVCWGDRVPVPTCRSCVHSTPVVDESTDGKWTCDKKGGGCLSVEAQKAGCADHLFIPLTINFAKQVDAAADAAGDWVEYENADGTRWRNSKRPNDYASAELVKLPAAMVGAGTVDAIKHTLGGVVQSVEPMSPADVNAELDRWVAEMVEKSTRVRVEIPQLYARAVQVWTEDDTAPDAERLPEAFKRITGSEYKASTPASEWKDDDRTLRVYAGGWIVQSSYRGNNAIRGLRV